MTMCPNLATCTNELSFRRAGPTRVWSFLKINVINSLNTKQVHCISIDLYRFCRHYNQHTTDVSTIPRVHSIQLYMIAFVSNVLQVSGFLHVLKYSGACASYEIRVPEYPSCTG
jgi:hypothetical protein